jgi:two-component system sensor histidine kinase AtoS
LQRRFFLSVAGFIAGLMVVVLLLVVSREGRLVRAEAEKRALAVAGNLAATSDTALRTYNYVALEQSAEKAAREADVAYVIFLDKEGRVAAFSAHDEYQGTVLGDPVSRRAQAAAEPLVQETTWGPPGARAVRVLDVAVPVLFRESTEKWGTVRIGLSLEPMAAELHRTRAALLALSLVALVLGFAGAHLLARRVTRPVASLAAGARDLAAGQVGLQLDIRTGDELEALAGAFNHMSAELAAKQQALEQNLALLVSLKRYQDDILRSMDEGLLTVDLEGRVVTVNRIGATLLGVGPEALAARPALEAILGAREPLARLIREGLDGGEMAIHAEVELHNNGGAPVPLGVSTAPLLDAAGARLGLLVLFRDLTDLKALEARMRRADRLAALGTMSAGLAHEIKNPLAAIKTFVQLIPRKFDSEVFREKFIVTVPRELDRVNGIVESLLDLARSPQMNFAPPGFCQPRRQCHPGDARRRPAAGRDGPSLAGGSGRCVDGHRKRRRHGGRDGRRDDPAALQPVLHHQSQGDRPRACPDPQDHRGAPGHHHRRERSRQRERLLGVPPGCGVDPRAGPRAALPAVHRVVHHCPGLCALCSATIRSRGR